MGQKSLDLFKNTILVYKLTYSPFLSQKDKG
jgi:hypothetical protein